MIYLFLLKAEFELVIEEFVEVFVFLFFKASKSE